MLKVRNRLPDPFAAEAVEAPKHQRIKLPVLGRLKHLVERLSLVPPLSAGLVIDVLAYKLVAFLLGELPKLSPLILFCLLPFARGNAEIEGCAFAHDA
nr:hypothetical protein [Salinibacter ruber]